MDQPDLDATSAALLAAIAAPLAHGDDLDATLAAVVSAAASTLGLEVATIFVQDPDRVSLEIAAAHGLADDAVGPFAAAVTSGQHPIAQVARTREAVWGRTEPPEAGSLVAADLPLSVTRGGVDVPLGVLSLAWPAGHEVRAFDRTIASALADLVAVAIDHARLASLVAERSDWFERMAHSDPLTGLANARTFARVLDLEVARASRQSSELAIALFDVDDFGGLNDEAGRAAGDDVLRAVASVLAGSVRLVDTVARYGGDEFVLVAPGTAGATVARRIVEGVADLPRVDGRPITVSAGIARFPVDGTTAEELLATAEASLGRAKAAGGGSLETGSNGALGAGGLEAASNGFGSGAI